MIKLLDCQYAALRTLTSSDNAFCTGEYAERIHCPLTRKCALIRFPDDQRFVIPRSRRDDELLRLLCDACPSAPDHQA